MRAGSVSSTARDWPRRWRARRDHGAGGAGRLLRRPALLDRHRRPGHGCADAVGAGAGDGRSRPRCCSSSSSGPRCPMSASRRCSPTRASTSARHHLRNVRRYREHLLSEPEERIVTEKSLTGASAWTRLFEELTSVIEVELPAEGENGDGAGTRRCPSKSPSPPAGGRPGGAAHERGGRHRRRSRRACAPAPSCSTRCSPTRRPTTACAPTRTGWPRGTSPTRPATSRSRR